MLHRRSLLALAAPAILPAVALGQTTLPDRALRIVVGFSPNGGADLMARTIAPALQRRIGRRVAVDNRAGNTGQAAAEALKLASSGDGSVIAFMPSTTLALRATNSSFPVDPDKDIAPITVAGTFQTALAVTPKSGATTLSEYVAWLWDGPAAERRRAGVVATDMLLQVYIKTLAREIDVPLDAIGYRGALPLTNDLEAGKLPAALGGVTSFLEYHRGGRIRMLAVSGSKRLATAPKVPTATELGKPGLLGEEWYGFYASSAVPPPIVAEWNRQICAVLADAEIAAQLTQYGLEVDGSTPQEATLKMNTHISDWRARMAAFGLKPSN
jgi:tripartite-type tricarboxylate transporter receptor subunit TctC